MKMQKCVVNESLLATKYGIEDWYGDFTNNTLMSKLTPCKLYNPCTDECFKDAYTQEFDSMWIEPYASTIYGFVYPGLLIVTIIANVFILIVLTRKHMINATNTVLLYMSIAQLLVAIVPAPFLVFYYTLGHYRHQDQIEASWCIMGHLLAQDALPPILNNAAIWLAVLLAAQRVVCVRAPILSRRVSTVKNVNIVTCFIIIISLLGNVLPFLTLSKIDVLKFEARDRYQASHVWKVAACLHFPSDFINKLGSGKYRLLYVWPRAIVFAFIPILLLITLTFNLIQFLRRNKERRSRLLEHKEKKRDATSLMLVLIVVVFVIVNLPMGVLLALFCLINVGAQIHIDPTAQSVAMMIDNLLILASYPVNFAIYCSMSAQFRTTFKKLFLDTLASHFKSNKGTVGEQIPLRQAESGMPQSHEDTNDCML